jgi:hypothetical protein
LLVDEHMPEPWESANEPAAETGEERGVPENADDPEEAKKNKSENDPGERGHGLSLPQDYFE